MTYEEQATIWNESHGKLNLNDGYDCNLCHNRGYIYIGTETQVVAVDCECLIHRNTLKVMRESGLEEQFDEYTFDKFKTNKPFEELMKERALNYLTSDKWFVVVGKSGIGKTHICTAILKDFIERNKTVKYVSYIELVRLNKDYMSGYEEVHEKAQREFNLIKEADILYIDDYLKVTSVPLEFIFEIVNHRYINKKPILLSSEKTYEEQMKWDSAVTSRIYQRTASGEYWLEIKNGDNHRLDRS